MYNFINRLTVTDDTVEFERAIGNVIEHMVRQPGFHSYQLYRSTDDSRIYVETAVWADAAAHRAAMAEEGLRNAVGKVLGLAKAEAGSFELVQTVGAVTAS
ncbi:antibiotic biosynthesis monooxygenase family protein [Nocardia sp. NPDC046473]|uniref:antibiotic biosynthesis monooxygenase family protein n=1 Tax=Nocardia sp. NPDC046473 TaxID=3155733 RepID=UPI0033D3BD90